MLMSPSSVIVGARSNYKATMALSSLARALLEMEKYAVARLVAKANKSPQLLLLAPCFEEDLECLVDIQLPFAEDVRPYTFPPLDRIETVNHKIVTEHAKLPNDSLKKAMSDFVDRMDLMTFGDDENGSPEEYAKLDETFSPAVHRLDQAIRWRAVNGSKPIPPPYDILIKYSKPPTELINSAQRQLDKLISIADVKPGNDLSLSITLVH
jgi:ATP-dependent DNA helicase 2 subunit 2